MRRWRAAAALVGVLLAAAIAGANPPRLNIPAEIKAVGDYVTLTPDTDAKAVTYVGQSGVEPFPSAFLRDPRAFILSTRGLAAGRYHFVAVGTLNDEQASAGFVVVVGEAPPEPGPGPGPAPTPATDPDFDKALFDALTPLYAADPTPPATKTLYRTVLAAFYRAAAEQAQNPAVTTLGQLYQALATALTGKLPKGTFRPLFDKINGGFATQLGNVPGTAMTPDLRLKAGHAFNAAAAALEALKP
jgi:hypothetical protein